MLTYLFFAIVIIYLLALLNARKGDLFYPPVIVCLAFVISLSFLILEMTKWDVNISADTFIVLFAGLTSYMFGSLFAEKVTRKIRIRKRQNHQARYSKDDISNVCVPDIQPLVTILIMVFDCMVARKYYYDVRRSALSIGSFNSLGSMIGLYRNAGAYGKLEVGISRFSSYGYMAMTAIAYLYLYIIIANIVSKRRITVKWISMNIAPVLLFGACSILTGGRNPLIQILVAAFMMFYLLHYRSSGKSTRFNMRFTIRLTVVVALALVAFSNMRGLVGRTNTLNIIDYLAMYIGAPIKLFDMFINNPPMKSHWLWGQETFINIWIWIGNLIDNKDMTRLIMNKEFRSYNHISLGNVYTAFREYYFDFGIVGVIVLSFIHSNIFTVYYEKIRMGQYYVRQNQFDLPLIIYAYLSVALAYYSIDDRFYQKFLSRGTFRELFLLVLFAMVLPKVKLKRCAIKPKWSR